MKHFKCLLLLSSLMICNAYGAADEKSKPDETRLSTHFELGAEPFDEEVQRWHAAISSNVIKTAKELKKASDYVQACTALHEKGLNSALENPGISARAQAHYAIIQENSAVIAAFTDALTARHTKKTARKRAKKWKVFRQVASRKLTLQEQAAIPGTKYPDPGKGAIKQWITENASLELNDEQKNQYTALQIVLFAFRQVHRKCDPESDDPNLLLHKKVTD